MAAPNLNAFLLGSRTITTAVTDITLTEGVSAANVTQGFWDRFAGINGLTIVAAFTYGGSGGTSAVVTVDTALGSGGVWTPVARIDFATTSATKQLVLSRTGIASAATLAAPSADAAINLIGDRFRARLTTVGTYGGTTLLDVRAQPHA